jgi:Na+-transporting NADH:ubiquinone oxidoreductase subunit E
MSAVNLLMVFIATLLTSNIALTYLLGMCPFIAMSKRLSTATGMGYAVVFVTTLTAAVNWPIYHLILVPLKAELIYYVVFIITIAAVVQLLEMLMEKFFPALQSSFGIFLPLITVNCIVLAVSLFMILRQYDFVTAVIYAFGSSVGWTLAIAIMAAINEKLALVGDIPRGLRGPGIVMVSAGIIALAFMGFSGMVVIQ